MSGYRHVRTAANPPPTASPNPPSREPLPTLGDDLPVELLELARKFRGTVENAVLGSVVSSDEGGLSMMSGRGGGGVPSPSSATHISESAGVELSRACSELVRYVAQLLKKNKDEYDELFVRHRGWRAKSSPSAANSVDAEQQHAHQVGSAVLTSLYGVVESTLAVTGSDRGILYLQNPHREELVGIVYGGGNSENVVEVPLTVQASRAEVLMALASSSSAAAVSALSTPAPLLTSCGVPKRTTIDPVALAFSLDAGINVGDMEAAKSVEEVRRGGASAPTAVRLRAGTNAKPGVRDVSVNPFGPLSGYATHSMLCVPVSLPASPWGFTASNDGDNASSAKRSTVGVLQLINKIKHAPSVTVGASNKVSVGVHPQFSEIDETLAHHAALTLGALLRWGHRADGSQELDFFSLESRQLSMELQRLSHKERTRCRDQDAEAVLRLASMEVAGRATKTLHKADPVGGGGSHVFTHTESASLVRLQGAHTAELGRNQRRLYEGDVLDSVLSQVGVGSNAASWLSKPPLQPPHPPKPREGGDLRCGPPPHPCATTIKSQKSISIHTAETGDAPHQELLKRHIDLTHAIFGASPLPRRDGALLIHRVAHHAESGRAPLPHGGDLSAYVVGASLIVDNLKDAWSHTHSVSQELQKRVHSLEMRLDQEQQRSRKLALLIRSAGLEVPRDLDALPTATPSCFSEGHVEGTTNSPSATHQPKTHTDFGLPPLEVSSELNLLQAKIAHLATKKRKLGGTNVSVQ